MNILIYELIKFIKCKDKNLSNKTLNHLMLLKMQELKIKICR